MKFKIAGFIFLLFAGCGAASDTDQQNNKWQKIWEDDFTGVSEPDSEKWSFSGRNTADWGRYCTDSEENVFIENDQLVLRSMLNTSESDTTRYQTACITTRDNFYFKYGKVEVRAKVSTGQGSWPAIWMMPQEAVYGGWPYSGEIDIMEHLNFDPFVYQTLHTEHTYINEERDNPPNHETAPIEPDEFNIYGIEWYPDRIDYFVNETKTFTYPRLDGADEVQWPFDQSFYLILNQALGGDWVGEINDEDLPVQMVLDWVRVYQQP